MQCSYCDEPTAYPRPVRFQEYSNGEVSGHCYCVGGALVLYFHQEDGVDDPSFPGERELATVLDAVCAFPLAASPLGYARTITQANDYGDFAGAWSADAHALRYVRQ